MLKKKEGKFLNHGVHRKLTRNLNPLMAINGERKSSEKNRASKNEQ